MTTQVKVRQVDGPNENGWYEIEFEDGNSATTKNKSIAERAMNRRGVEVTATINSRKRGNFTNHYLNEFDGITDEKPSANGASRSSGGSQRRGGKSPEEQRVISRQWAFGRAVELLMASGEEFTLPLDGKIRGNLETTADYLYEQVQK